MGQMLRTLTRLEQSQRLSQGQIQAQRLNLRWQILTALNNERYEPQAVCPNLSCGRILDVVEILKGFRRDPLEITTECPKCRQRFQPHLIHFDTNYSRTELVFYCPSQALYQLQQVWAWEPAKIRHEKPSLFHSILTHFGGLRAAFLKIHIDYLFEDSAADWEDKIRPFLGRAPDTLIASCAGRSKSTIRQLRQSLNIKPYR